MSVWKRAVVASLGIALVASACGGPGAGDVSDDGVKTGRGVDASEKVIRIGGLYDLSGVMATLGVPWEAAVSAALDQVNDSGRLGDWTLEQVSRDHGFNPSNAVAMYDSIKDDVLAIAPAIGTQPIAPLLPRFVNDNMLAFVGGGATSSQTSHTIWGFSSYHAEAARGVQYAFETKGDDLRLGVVYTSDDSGADVLEGFREAAEQLDIEIEAEVALEPTADDFSAAVGRLEEAGVTDVVLGTAGGLSSGVVSTASGRDFRPDWYGILPSFLEVVWYDTLDPSAWADNFYWVHGVPYWGENRPGMEEFLADYEASSAAADFPAPQVWALVGYLQVQQLVGIIEVAIDNEDLTPEGLYAAAESMDDYDADGLLLGPMDALGGEGAASRTRVLKADVANKSWTVVGDVSDGKN